MAARPNNRAESPIEPATGTEIVASDVEKAAEAVAAAEAEAEHPLRGLFLRYTGPQRLEANKEALKKRAPILGEGTLAVLTPKDWADVGITTTQTHTWSLANQYRIPASQFTAQQIEHLLSVSTRFELINAQGEKASL